MTSSILRSCCVHAVLSAALLLASPSGATADDGDWPRFRGPLASGVAADNERLPTKWSKTDNVLWAVNVPGWGWSCPIVWGDCVFLSTVVSDEQNTTPSKGLYLGQGVREPAKGVHHWLVCCFDLNTGELRWKREAHTGRPQVPRHPKSTYAAETAATDGERVYVLFGDVGLYCYDLQGQLLWSKKIEPKRTFMDYGAAASPVVHDGQVFVVYDNIESSWIAAYDAKTGEQRWRQARDETHSWATPLVWENELRTELVVPGKRRNRSYSLDGELLWEFDGQMSNLVIPSPFAAHGLCYIASGYVGDAHRPTFAIKPGASGEIAKTGKFADAEHIVWHLGKSAPYNPSQIVYGDYLYTLYDRGFLTCHDAKTGEEVYGKQRFTPRGSFTASPWAYNGRLFFLSEDGRTYAVKAGREFKIVSTSDLDELCLSCPAVAGDKLLIRTAGRLYCITEGAKLPAKQAADLDKPRPARPDDTGIWAAARAGRTADLVWLAKAGKVNARDSNGSTALMIAALHGHGKTVKAALEQRADSRLANLEGNTALHMAAFPARVEIVKMLLGAGADVQAKNQRGQTPLQVASSEWTPQLERIYGVISDQMGVEFDLKRIQRDRQLVAKLLREANDANPPQKPAPGK